MEEIQSKHPKLAHNNIEKRIAGGGGSRRGWWEESEKEKLRGRGRSQKYHSADPAEHMYAIT